MASQKYISSLEMLVSNFKYENACLRKENEFLKSHPTLVAGMKGETLIAHLTNGYLTTYASKHDVVLKNLVKIEVKYSNHSEDKRSRQLPKRYRWAWNKPEGHLNRGKDFDFLLLVGNKDERFKEDYLDESPFIYILLPTSIVKKINSRTVTGKSQGGTLNLDADIYGIKEGYARGLRSKLRQMILVTHMVSEDFVCNLEEHARPSSVLRMRKIRPALTRR